MPRLLILCEYPTLLGCERSMLATLPAVAAARFDIRVAAPPNGLLAATLRQRGIPHVPWQTHDEHGQRLPLSQLRAELAALIERERPDLVHANSLSTSRIAGPTTTELGLPSIGHLRDIVKLSRQVIEDLNVHRRLIAVSRATRDFHCDQGLDAAKCVVVHNGVDLDQFHPRPKTGYLHRELNLPPTPRLIATIGQLGLRKGTDTVLRAALLTAPRVADAHWLIIGERTSNKDESRAFETELRSLAAEPALAGRVHFLGSRADVPQLLPECTLLVHAARQEPLGRVLLEAAASGLAIVATDVGGTREIFPTEEDGAILFAADGVDGLSSAMIGLLEDEGQRQSVSKAARRRAEAAFNIHQAAARLIEQYREVIDSQ